MVGRDAELGRLQSAFLNLLTAAPLASLTVVGDAGLGKSRLLHEFGDWVQRQPQHCEWFEARASEARRSRPYGLLGDLFRSRFRILESDDEPMVTDKWLQSMAPILGSQADAAILGNLLGFGFETHAAVSGVSADPKQIRDRGFYYAAAYFSRVAQARSEGEGPALLVLDDLHWADDGSLDFVDYFQSTHAETSALFLGFARPQLFERRPNWGKDHRRHERIDLDPLDAASSLLLADALLKKLVDVPVHLRELIVGRGEGNPFYMEELVRMLIDDGVIVAKGERWEIATDRPIGARVPGTLTGVLQARLDALSPLEKRALQDASVIGHVFWDEALRALNPRAVQALPGLLERDLVRAHDPASFEGTREFAFKHHLLHQVTYDGVLKREKRVLHGKTAQWLVARSDDRAMTLLPLVAEHFERAGDSAAAVRYWQRAAEGALARDAREAALSFANRAVTLVGESDAERRFALAVIRDRVFTRRFERDARLANLLEMERLALLVGNDNMQFDAALCRASYLESGGDFEGALPVARGALQRANGGTPSQRARAFNRIANALIRLGRYAEASEPVRLGLDAAREARNVQTETELLNMNGLMLSELGDVVEARGWYEQALAKQKAIGNPLGVARSVGNLAEIDRMLGRYELAHAGFVEQARVSKLIGDPWLEAMAELNLSLVVLNQGDALGAAQHAQHALGAFRKMGERWGEACALVNAGHAELGNGRLDSALESYETAQHRFDQLGVHHLALEAMAGIADTLLSAGDTSGAMDQVEAILGRLAEGVGLDGLDEPLRLRWSCYRVLHAASDERAMGMLAVAQAELMARAEKVSDPQLRDRLLNDVPYHRAIVHAWSRG
jgi:predicted ATPase